MTPLKQLFRQPVRLFAIFLLVGMASAFICASVALADANTPALRQIKAGTPAPLFMQKYEYLL